MAKQKILVQLDPDPMPSVFDRVVAVDAGADRVFAYGGVTPENVAGLIHGCVFTRGPQDLKSTAVFVGGSDAAKAEQILEAARKAMVPKYGLTVSILLDPNGANTTAAAAVKAAQKHLNLSQCKALVLGGTGPVGQRVARLLTGRGAHVRLASRDKARAATACDAVRKFVPDGQLEAVSAGGSADAPAALEGRDLVVACGAAGVLLLPKKYRESAGALKVLIDLNAVPPAGIEGVEAPDKGQERDGIFCYGALGVGGVKMKIHRAAVAKLFEANTLVMDAEEVFDIEV